MGEHKHNPTAIAAKKGELTQKKPRTSKRQKEALMMKEIERITGVDKIKPHLNGLFY